MNAITYVSEPEVRWTPAEVHAIHTGAPRDLAAEQAEANGAPLPAQRDCAMAACEEPVNGPPLVVNVPTMPGPFAVDLCERCREPFEAGMEAVERLAGGDAEALPFRFGGRRRAECEAER